MALKYKVVIPVFMGLLASVAAISPAFAEEPDRTADRAVSGLPHFSYPDYITAKPDHYQFSARVSNSDPLTQHPNQWDGQDWDPSKWPAGWTPQIAVQKFFKARIFTRRYMRYDMPVVELGPTFYKLSDLDQRRTLKLLTDQANVFGQGYKAVDLVDWYTHDSVGVYTAKGMFLN